MNPKIKKIDAEYEKNAAKIAELQARQKELEKQRTEYENLDIIGLVRSMGVTPEELAAIMQAARQNQAAPAINEKEEPDYAETEND
jgi:flagellar basal body P-ring protein FlgI